METLAYESNDVLLLNPTGRLHKVVTDVKAPYRHHCPEIIGTVTPEMRNTVKPPNHA